VGYIAYNTQKGILKNTLVRQALDMSINKNQILDTIYPEIGTLAVNPMPPSQWGYDNSIQNAPFNIDTAHKLLTQAGVPKGTTLNLWYMPVQRAYNPDAKKMAELLKVYWEKLGLQVNLITYPWSEYLQRITKGEYDIALIGAIGDSNTPDSWLSATFGCQNINGTNESRWCSSTFEQLLNDAKRLPDKQQRLPKYHAAQRLIKQQVPVSPIAHSLITAISSTRVKGLSISPIGPIRFNGVSVQ
jgi:dipeptide transport system substrate-binding protein